MIDRKSKILFGISAFVVMISIVITYYRYVVLKDFEIFTDEEMFNKSLSEE
mgnify:CR=1